MDHVQNKKVWYYVLFCEDNDMLLEFAKALDTDVVPYFNVYGGIVNSGYGHTAPAEIAQAVRDEFGVEGATELEEEMDIRYIKNGVLTFQE
eukprot:CAMPEP_0202707294 /NCGR_PEP_ID=MMETSP1385-20130828/19631_1 /ASSEMBLY_ACC=CAM_ASM_000861 /TAXON_ID=933848 /ORGANISM="Elphidium margaritaceum" /LENGTH=90 /DNA_ID=CAMNT_0049365979 /DNA_START=195 /DNA_END=464 /DNA_ORIENTATION=+